MQFITTSYETHATSIKLQTLNIGELRIKVKKKKTLKKKIEEFAEYDFKFLQFITSLLEVLNLWKKNTTRCV